MIDLVFYAADRQSLVTWAKTHPPANPLVEEVDDGEGGTHNQVRPGLEWSWWAGSGKFKTAEGTYDQDGNEITPPTYAPGVVMLMRIHSEFFNNDRLNDEPADPEDIKEWERSRIAKYVRDNGTPGTMGSIPYYEVNGVRLFRRKDVDTFLANNNIAGHGFL